MRKLLSTLLAFLVLVCVCFPCSDGEIVPSGKTEAFITAANDCGGHHAEDACSPFCSCTCCAGFTVPHAQVFCLKPLSAFGESVFAAYLSDAIREIALPIWQPPQLV